MSTLPTFARNPEHEQIVDMAHREQRAAEAEEAIRQEQEARKTHDETVQMVRDICYHLRLPFWYHCIKFNKEKHVYRLSKDWQMEVWSYKPATFKVDETRLHLIVDFRFRDTSPTRRLSIIFDNRGQTIASTESLRRIWTDCLASLHTMEETRKEREEAVFTAVWNELADTYPDDFAPAEECYEEPDEYPFDPATEVIEVIDLGIEVTSEGFLLQREQRIYADGHEDTTEYYLEYTCWDGKLPY